MPSIILHVSVSKYVLYAACSTIWKRGFFYTIAYCGVARYWYLAIDGLLNNRIDIQIGRKPKNQ